MRTVLVWVIASTTLLLGACGEGDDVSMRTEGPRIIATTSILGDVVSNLVGDDAEVEVIMPPNADPHDFAPSAKQAAALRDADIVVVNGLGFEAGLDDALHAAEDDGVTVLAATDYVETTPFGASDHTDEGDDHEAEGAEHADEADHEDEADDHAAEADHDDHDHEGDDPHVFTDPARMAIIARGLADDLAEAIPALATPSAEARAGAYVDLLVELDEQVESVLTAVPAGRRLLVTNHDVFGYFADRYDFEVAGSVIPGGSTLAEPSAADLADLAGKIDELGVPAIFVEASASRRLAEALAAEGAEVEIVELYSESLGEAGSDGATYVDMVRTNAERIAEALA